MNLFKKTCLTLLAAATFQNSSRVCLEITSALEYALHGGTIHLLTPQGLTPCPPRIEKAYKAAKPKVIF